MILLVLMPVVLILVVSILFHGATYTGFVHECTLHKAAHVECMIKLL